MSARRTYADEPLLAGELVSSNERGHAIKGHSNPIGIAQHESGPGESVTVLITGMDTANPFHNHMPTNGDAYYENLARREMAAEAERRGRADRQQRLTSSPSPKTLAYPVQPIRKIST